MKITLCSSIATIDQMEQLTYELEELVHMVKFPSTELILADRSKVLSSEYCKQKKTSSQADIATWNQVHTNIVTHFKKIEWSEVVLICNYDKSGIAHYIGPNTLMEMGVALAMHK